VAVSENALVGDIVRDQRNEAENVMELIWVRELETDDVWQTEDVVDGVNDTDVAETVADGVAELVDDSEWVLLDDNETDNETVVENTCVFVSDAENVEVTLVVRDGVADFDNVVEWVTLTKGETECEVDNETVVASVVEHDTVLLT
jgi:hypothetical protein